MITNRLITLLSKDSKDMEEVLEEVEKILDLIFKDELKAKSMFISASDYTLKSVSSTFLEVLTFISNKSIIASHEDHWSLYFSSFDNSVYFKLDTQDVHTINYKIREISSKYISHVKLYLGIATYEVYFLKFFPMPKEILEKITEEYIHGSIHFKHSELQEKFERDFKDNLGKPFYKAAKELLQGQKSKTFIGAVEWV